MLDGTTLLLSGTASLPPRTGRGVATSLLVAYWAVRLSISSVVYLKGNYFPLASPCEGGKLSPFTADGGSHSLGLSSGAARSTVRTLFASSVGMCRGGSNGWAMVIACMPVSLLRHCTASRLRSLPLPKGVPLRRGLGVRL
jgi:hypothetical protein